MRAVVAVAGRVVALAPRVAVDLAVEKMLWTDEEMALVVAMAADLRGE